MRRHFSEGGWILVWDIPARICHWGFSFSLLGALLFGFYADPESDWFKGHMLFGVLCCWFLAVRILLGFFGGRYLRWNRFFYGARATLKYLGDALKWRSVDFVGLNPGSAAFAAAIYLAAPALVWTGFVLELAESWHERIAWASLSLIGAHLLGLALHALRHRAVTPFAMIHGKVRGFDHEGLTHSGWQAGVALAALSIGFCLVLFWCFDFDSAALSIPFMPDIGFPMMQKG